MYVDESILLLHFPLIARLKQRKKKKRDKSETRYRQETINTANSNLIIKLTDFFHIRTDKSDFKNITTRLYQSENIEHSQLVYQLFEH